MFLHKTLTDDKGIHYNIPKRQKVWVHPGEPNPPMPKQNIHDSKIILYIWRDQKGVIYYELLQQTINNECYKQ